MKKTWSVSYNWKVKVKSHWTQTIILVCYSQSLSPPPQFHLKFFHIVSFLSHGFPFLGYMAADHFRFLSYPFSSHQINSFSFLRVKKKISNGKCWTWIPFWNNHSDHRDRLCWEMYYPRKEMEPEWNHRDWINVYSHPRGVWGGELGHCQQKEKWMLSRQKQ